MMNTESNYLMDKITVGALSLFTGLFMILFSVFQADIISEMSENIIDMKKCAVTLLVLLGYIFFCYILTKKTYAVYFDMEQGYRQKIISGYMSQSVCKQLLEDSSEGVVALTVKVESVVRNHYLVSIKLIEDGIILAFSLLGLVYIQPALGLIELAASLLILIVSEKLAGILSEAEENAQAKNEIVIGRLLEYLKGMIVIHNYSSEQRTMNQFSDVCEESVIARKKADNLNLNVEMFGVGGNMLTYMGLFALGCLFVIKGYCGIGVVVAVSVLINEVMMYGNNMAQDISAWKSVSGVKSELDSYVVNAGKEFVNERYNALDLTKNVALKGNELSFAYGEKAVFNHVSFCVNKGEKVVVMGESGIGKSSLLKGIMRRNDGLTGELFLFGKSITEMQDEELYSYIAYVPQEPIIYTGTIADNITMFDAPDNTRLFEAMKKAGINPDESEMSESRIVSYGGEDLSGGQKLRIALARALYTEKKLILLDEVFAALDEATAREIEKAIMTDSGLTIMMVSHRVFEKDLYDKIMRLSKFGMEVIS